MIIKKVESEELLTLPEVRDILNRIKEEREKAGQELRYEQKRAVEHANLFAKVGAKESRDMVNELLTLEKMKLDIAVKIANLCPRTKDELRAIYAKERFTLSEAELKAILDIVGKYIQA
ncbi:DNA-directed RNA polymerase, subunit F [Methanocella conradii HZ254]|uniref:DNA-directed RNA polymerase subunit Rpo4 n=1 Tax=Methanocella conradii (strain DSM 24694 / JCM 17849 / CGMCC 1.5162 / HZ254) TaxID=1041930 RepID=H8IAX4_METCZ|nr:RNA polymerase Rpb4 family protein [Methanocella conradii]AFD00984.1 DNA-directed RNA polymerase, subunit F [Methanocella conradii HZ254]MDI6897667.1 RNA polymerase Rpb4 family protein [Methanocella conradii]